ncbi:hypothetical protein AVEN_145227-1 [Araneus ventricosus]|uniref:Uncharacterized protein n=1 Tax=Araneus ventricosus TaxID=182803 RepID=A0A4Y2NFE4_ARAVE|nr:hypothetical protein AVEN_145227-1 [Araneus ventricosus]
MVAATFSYANCAHLHLQDVQDLENTMGADEYEKFTTQGNFTIQQAFKSGTWSDMTMEQSLMKNMKTFVLFPTFPFPMNNFRINQFTESMPA